VRYALVIYNDGEALARRSEEEGRRVFSAIDELLAQPPVTGWVRLQALETATTVRSDPSRTLLTDGPFVDSKDYLGGLILVEAENLDGALAVAREFQEIRGMGAIEVRPVAEGPLAGA
jgi:hypothetical protein